MEFTILGIGAETSLGNVSVRMQYGENVQTDLGEAVVSRVARIVVKSDTLAKAEGETVNLDMDSTFKFEQREFIVPEGEENAGAVLDLTWIVKR